MLFIALIRASDYMYHWRWWSIRREFGKFKLNLNYLLKKRDKDNPLDTPKNVIQFEKPEAALYSFNKCMVHHVHSKNLKSIMIEIKYVEL